MEDSRPTTILFLGDGDVGISTLLSRFSTGAAPLRDSDQPFVFELRAANGQQYRLEIFDTHSPVAWQRLEPQVVVLCYDISRPATLQSVQTKWHREVQLSFSAAQSDELPVLVLGLKRDVRSAGGDATGPNPPAASSRDPDDLVYPPDGLRIAQELRADRYMECSARTGELISAVWEDLCRTAVATTRAPPGGGMSAGGCRML